MDRRTALATAGAIAIVTLTGGAAVAANLGLLAEPAVQDVGQLQPTDPELTTILVEPAPGQQVSDEAPPAAGGGEAYEGENEYEEEEHEGEEAEHEESEEEHEYEGADDDD